MRSLRAALILCVFTLGVAGTASAVPTVSVEFEGGASTITVLSSSSTVVASVFIDLTEDPGTNGYSLSVDSGGDGEVAVLLQSPKAGPILAAARVE